MENSTITLHPQASDLLFKHYQTISRIFRDVLGQLEIDYMAIALLTIHDEVLFFSSRPGIEWNMIEHNLWLSDARFQHDFFRQEQPQAWDEQRPSELNIGLSIPSVLDAFRVVYTFASKSNNVTTQTKILNNIAMLIRMGRFCLKNILNELPFLNLKFSSTQPQPRLKLIINKSGVL